MPIAQTAKLRYGALPRITFLISINPIYAGVVVPRNLVQGRSAYAASVWIQVIDSEKYRRNASPSKGQSTEYTEC
jgi:hypothetical protein